MNCPTEIEIPNLTEPCENTYLSSSCIFIPEANVTLDLPANASQTQVNAALTSALVYKEQQIVALQALIDALDARIVNLETP